MDSEILKDLIQRCDPAPARFCYRVDLGGKEVDIELPFVTGVFANFSGNTPENDIPVEARNFAEIDIDSFDTVLAHYSPRIRVSLPNDSSSRATDTFQFNCMDDFSPRNLDPRNLSLEVILNDPGFLELEATWRGLFYLVNAIKTYKLSSIKIFDISKSELSDTFQSHGLTPKNPLVEKAYIDTFLRPGGKPFGLFVGDYFFNQQKQADTEILCKLGKFSELVFAPFISGASPENFGLNSFRAYNYDNADQIQWDRSDRDAWISWKTLRESNESRFLGLTLPRILIRKPHGMSDELGEYFQNLGPEDGITEPCYANSAFAMALNIHRAHQVDGFPTRLRGMESGGRIEEPEDFGLHGAHLVEASISDRQEYQFAKSGYIPLLYREKYNDAFFVSAQSVHQTEEYDDPDRTANDSLISRFPYLLVGCRMMHYLKCIFRDTDISDKPEKEIEDSLKSWLSNYVVPESAGNDYGESANFFDAAALSIGVDKSRPNFICLSVAFRPLFALAGMTSMMRLNTLLLDEDTLHGQDLEHLDLSVLEPYGFDEVMQ